MDILKMKKIICDICLIIYYAVRIVISQPAPLYSLFPDMFGCGT